MKNLEKCGFQKKAVDTPWIVNSTLSALGNAEVGTVERNNNVAYQYIRLADGTYLENVVVPNRIDSYLVVGNQAQFHFCRLKLPKKIFLSNYVTYLYAITLPSGETISGVDTLRKQLRMCKLVFGGLSVVGGLVTIPFAGFGLVVLYNAARWFTVKGVFPQEA